MRYRSITRSLSASLVRSLVYFSILSYSLFVLALSFQFFKLEKSKFDLLSKHISSTLKSALRVKDEISIRTSLNRILELNDLLGVEVSGSGIDGLRDTRPGFDPTRQEAESTFWSLLKSDILTFHYTSQLYPNSNEDFTIRFWYANTSRRDIFQNSLFITLVLLANLSVMLTLGSKMLIDKKMMGLSIEEEKSRLASRIFHLMKSDVKQMIELIDDSRDLDSQKRILMRTILRSILGTASKFIRGESENSYSIDRYERASVGNIIQEMIGRKEIEFARKKGKEIAFAFDTSPEVAGTTLKTIPNELKLAISNIVDNAFDAIPAMGRIVFAVEVDDELLHLSITDSGVGIPKGNIEKVFEFGQSFKPNGNGMGLSQAKEIVSALGGEISLSSIEGKGTTITISMLRDSSGQKYEQPDVSLFDFVLIDDSNVRRINSQKRAELKGKRLGVFRNVSEFRESIRKNDFDKNIPIYLDSDLGEDEPGEVSAKNLFYEHGFQNIILYTAGNLTQLRSRAMPWIREIIGKDEAQNLPV